VVQAVKSRGLNERAAAIAIATTIVETSIANLDGGDLDSVGLFQQRNSWGSFAERTNPAWATNKFLDVMQSFYPNGSWNTAPIGDVAADVQRPAEEYRYRYAVEANDAVTISRLLWNGSGSVNHRLRRADGTWTVFGDLDMHSATQVAAAADASGVTHALAITGGQLHHRIRNANGTWTTWGLVASSGVATAVTAATGAGGVLQVAAVVNGQVQHRVRNANGTWTPWGAAGAAGGTFTAVAGAVDVTADVFHLAAVFNGQIHHRIRNANGTWTAWALAGNPGTAIALGAAVDGSRNLHLVTAY
jgi:hypothetical protein